MGYRDRSTGDLVLGSHGRRDVALPIAGHANVRVGRLRRLGQTLGHQRGRLQADIPRSRVGHQRRDVLPERVRVRDGQRRRHLSAVRRTGGPRAGDVQSRQHHLRHHQCRLQQVRTSVIGRLRRFQL